MTENQPPKIVKQVILHVLLGCIGEKKRIPRGELLHQINRRLFRKAMLNNQDSYHKLTDRQMRAYLEWLRANDPQGALICSSLKGGYFLARDARELEANLSSDENRAKKTLRRISRQKKMARFLESPQMEMPL
jgi:hypothetical protein